MNHARDAVAVVGSLCLAAGLLWIEAPGLTPHEHAVGFVVIVAGALLGIVAAVLAVQERLRNTRVPP
jgi:hypothetical protein